MIPLSNTPIPLEAQYLFRLGLEMIDRKKDDKALVYLRQAVFIAPGFSKAYRELGDCLARCGRQDEATVYRMKASLINPRPLRSTFDKATMKGMDADQVVAGSLLPCRIW